MKILYIGDVMGEPGINVVGRILPELKTTQQIDLAIAQSENVTDGKGMSLADMEKLQSYGVDFFTGGNHSIFRDQVLSAEYPVLRPANYPPGTPGQGWKYHHTDQGDVLVISLLGSIVGRDADKPVLNPLQTVDQILQANKAHPTAATIVNFHGDYSSEKRVIGYYLDGQASAVIGDHWHVPTADAQVLPKGTAHITDVGMCGTLHSSLGVKTEVIINRWRDGKVRRNELELAGPLQFNAVIINVNSAGLADAIEPIQRIID